MTRARATSLVMTVAVFLLTTPTVASAQAAVTSYTRNGIVQFPRDHGPAFDVATDLPVPFEVPIPRPNSAKFRRLDRLEGILADRQSPHVRVFQVGGATPPRGSSRGRTMFLNVITSADGVGSPQSNRPDQCPKGRAFITAGFHGREWQAYEAVIRKIEEFRSRKFAPALDALRNKTAAGGRNVFYAENVVMAFMPLMNPGSIEVTHKFPDGCQIVLRDLATNVVDLNSLAKDCLREGRLRYKNLNGSDGILGKDSSDRHGADDLAGVELSGGMDEENDEGTTNPLADSYNGRVREGLFEREALVWQDVLASSVVGLPRLPTTTRYTGVASLDVHNAKPLGEVHIAVDPFSPLPGAAHFDRYAQELAKGAGAARVARFADKGTALWVLAKRHGIPAAILELVPDPSIEPGYFGGAPRVIMPVTQKALQGALIGEAALPNALAMGQRGIDTALYWAAGPPYVVEVLILQKKDFATTSYDVTKTDADAEVIYWGRWEGAAPGSLARNPVLLARGNRWLNGNRPVTIRVSFSKPMRTTEQGVPPTVVALMSPIVDLKDRIVGGTGDGGRWAVGPKLFQFETDAQGKPTRILSSLGPRRYELDTWIGTFEPPDDITISAPTGRTKLRIAAQDDVGLEVDGRPASVATYQDGSFSGYEDASGVDGDGGHDESHDKFKIDTKRPNAR